MREREIESQALVARVIADNLTNLAFFIVFLVYPSCSSAVFNHFRCTTFDGPGEDSLSVMTIDNSIDCNSVLWITTSFCESSRRSNSATLHAFLATHQVLWVCRFVAPDAFVMIGIFPIGTPCLYMAMLYTHRERIQKLCRDEERMQAEATLERVRRRSIAAHGLLATGGDTSKSIARLDSVAGLTLDDDETEERLEALHLHLPSTMRKLTNGYELRTFWWEVFECFRKISLIAVPIFFKEGSIDQLTAGLVICFVTFSTYTAFAPFISHSDDVLSIVCQLQIFFTLLSAVLKQANPNSVIMSSLMPIMILIPPAVALILEFDVKGLIQRLRQSRCVAYVERNLIARFDRLLGVKPMYSAAEYRKALERELRKKRKGLPYHPMLDEMKIPEPAKLSRVTPAAPHEPPKASTALQHEEKVTKPTPAKEGPASYVPPPATTKVDPPSPLDLPSWPATAIAGLPVDAGQPPIASAPANDRKGLAPPATPPAGQLLSPLSSASSIAHTTREFLEASGKEMEIVRQKIAEMVSLCRERHPHHPDAPSLITPPAPSHHLNPLLSQCQFSEGENDPKGSMDDATPSPQLATPARRQEEQTLEVVEEEVRWQVAKLVSRIYLHVRCVLRG